MINDIAILAEKVFKSRKRDSRLLAKMESAKEGQAPKFLLISSIHRSTQDLQLLNMEQGDAFHGTRVSKQPLLHPDNSSMLFAGPAAYNSHFPDKQGIILPFDHDEPEHVISHTLESISQHPDLDEIPRILLRVNYETGDVSIINHTQVRNVGIENALVSQIVKPTRLDPNVLIFLCSDSRVQPPPTPHGLPMAIQTLGAHIPEYCGYQDETTQLNDFFENWFSQDSSEKRIFIIEHGSFDREGPHCGAGNASLNLETIQGVYLRPVIEQIQIDASRFERIKSQTAEDRVLALGHATERNIRSYPAVQKAKSNGVNLDDLIQITVMDTVEGVLIEVG